MKKIALLSLFSLLLNLSASAQFSDALEIKSFPYTAFFPSFPVFPIGIEAIVNEHIGIQFDGILMSFDREHIGVVYLSSKYYFFPKYGADGYYIGIFGGLFAMDGFGVGVDGGIGLMVGQKLINSKNWLLDATAGIGLGTIGTPTVPYFQLNIGYRFNFVERE